MFDNIRLNGLSVVNYSLNGFFQNSVTHKITYVFYLKLKCSLKDFFCNNYSSIFKIDLYYSKSLFISSISIEK